jgi:glycosyltransferase involved in cell wall biosynthesis
VGLVTIEDVCLSYHWSLPNKLFETIQAGLPVVAADLPEIGDVVNGYGVGVTVDVRSPESIARGVDSVLDAANYGRFRANARLAAEALTWENEKEKLLEVYRRLLSES